MNLKKAEFYVGSNWRDGEREGTFPHTFVENVMRQTMENYHLDGYTYCWMRGAWMGKEEDTLYIMLYTSVSNPKLYNMANDMRFALSQDSVLLAIDGKPNFINH